MRNYFIKSIILSLLSLAIIGCNQVGENRININSSSLIDTYTSKDKSKSQKTLLIKKDSFDIDNFVSHANILLTSINKKRINLTFKIDTIKTDKINKRSFFYAFNHSDKTLIKLYTFYLGQTNKLLNFWFVDATFQDNKTADKVFNKLHKLSGTVNGKDDYLPGLTYTNDYVIETDKKIYWLNTGCIYKFDSHLKLKELILKSIKIDKIIDSIYCKCGQPECSLTAP